MFNVRPLMAFTLLLALPLSATVSQGCAAAPRPANGPGFVFSPKVLNFGRVPWGEQDTQLLTLTLDKRRFDADRLPAWTSGDFNGNVTITQFSRREDHDHVILIYQVSLPTDMPGQFSGWIKLIYPSAVDMAADPRDRPLENQGVLLTGEIVPGVAVSPSMVDFGRVSQGQEATAYFTLAVPVDSFVPLQTEPSKPAIPAGYDLGSLGHIPFVSSSRHVSARARFGQGSMFSNGMTYQATLDPATPAGFFQGTFTFTTSAGQIIVIPVYAQVEASTDNKK